MHNTTQAHKLKQTLKPSRVEAVSWYSEYTQGSTVSEGTCGTPGNRVYSS